MGSGGAVVPAHPEITAARTALAAAVDAAGILAPATEPGIAAAAAELAAAETRHRTTTTRTEETRREH
jgi:hypothetical protein